MDVRLTYSPLELCDITSTQTGLSLRLGILAREATFGAKTTLRLDTVACGLPPSTHVASTRKVSFDGRAPIAVHILTFRTLAREFKRVITYAIFLSASLDEAILPTICDPLSLCLCAAYGCRCYSTEQCLKQDWNRGRRTVIRSVDGRPPSANGWWGDRCCESIRSVHIPVGPLQVRGDVPRHSPGT